MTARTWSRCRATNAALTASAANDTFVFQFTAQTAAKATIGNFDVAHDVLQLSHATYADAGGGDSRRSQPIRTTPVLRPTPPSRSTRSTRSR